MKDKTPFLTLHKAQEIIQDVPTPFHVYDEKGIRENMRRVNKAFAWNKGFKEYFAVKALPNPDILQNFWAKRAAAWTARPTRSFCSAGPSVFPAKTSCFLPT